MNKNKHKEINIIKCTTEYALFWLSVLAISYQSLPHLVVFKW